MKIVFANKNVIYRMEIFLSNFATFRQTYWSLSLNVHSSLFFVFLFDCWTCRQNNERTGGQGKTGDLSMTGVARFAPLRDHTQLSFELIYRVRWKRVRLWSVQFSMKQRGVFYPTGVALTLDSMLPILTPGWREALWASDLPKNTTRCFRPGLEPVPLDSDTRALAPINPSNFSFARDWSKLVAWLNIPQLKQGNIRVMFLNFQNNAAKNIWRISNTSYLLLWWCCCLFLKARSFPRENDTPADVSNRFQRVSLFSSLYEKYMVNLGTCKIRNDPGWWVLCKLFIYSIFTIPEHDQLDSATLFS